ncbi:MAG: ABC transporter substrate-binding protein [Methylococcaceae bacterium]|nr:ABC transporter substrate-binding protein [Methylococcaceae bacterium]
MTVSSEWIHAGGSEGLEQTRLTLGFIPLTDCAPLVVAREKGLFRKYGLEVELSRQVSWANIRDKVAVGALDGAHMLAAMPIAISLGLGEIKTPIVAALSLDLNGNAITVSKDLYRRMAEADPEALADGRDSSRALAKVVAAGRDPMHFAMVFPFSTHNYLLRYWLATAGIVPERDIRLTVVPPPYMVDALRSGDIDGYCVGEPWNEQAVAADVGRSLIADYDIWNNHPEKVFGVTREWAEAHPNTHQAVLMALLEAAAWIDRPENREEVVAILAQERYIAAPPEVVRMSMSGSFRHGIDAEPLAMPDFNVFHRYAANFPWQSHAVWFITQMYRWGQIDEAVNIRKLAEQVYRPDIYRDAARELGLAVPMEAYKTEGLHDGPRLLDQATKPVQLGPDCFCDGRVFDPADPVGYLAGFEIHNLKLPLDELGGVNP